jgi:hypothetical protein
LSNSEIGAALRRLFQEAADALHDAYTLTALRLFDRILGPFPETPTDRAIREEGEQLRKAFPEIDFDDPRRGVPRSPERRHE